MKKIALIICISFFKIAFAQNTYTGFFDVKSFTDSISTPGIKKYGVKMSFNGYPNPLQFVVLNPATGIFFYGDSIPDLIRDTSRLPELPFYCYAIDLVHYPDTVAYNKIVPNQKCYHFVDLFPNTLSNCDGHLNFTLDTVGKRFPFPNTYTLMPSDFNLIHIVSQTQFGLIPVSMGNNNYDTLCPGYYFLSIMVLPPGASVFRYVEQYYFTINWPFNQFSNTQVIVNPYATTSATACLGKASVNIVGGTPPYTYSFDGGAFLGVDSISNLCSGFHTVNVLDFMGVNNTAYFIINIDSSVYNNTPPPVIPVDTIICNFANCNFNYNMPVDSASLINFSVIDTNTVFFTWEIWQSGTSTIVSDTVSYLYQPGTNMVSLIMFCGNAKSQISNGNFRTIRVNDFTALPNVSLTTGLLLGRKDMDLNIYPNPFNNEIFISSKKTGITFNNIINSLGETMNVDVFKDDNGIMINTRSLPKGIYFITISDLNKNTSTMKVIK
jgi:hypothetical protein